MIANRVEAESSLSTMHDTIHRRAANKLKPAGGSALIGAHVRRARRARRATPTRWSARRATPGGSRRPSARRRARCARRAPRAARTRRCASSARRPRPADTVYPVDVGVQNRLQINPKSIQNGVKTIPGHTAFDSKASCNLAKLDFQTPRAKKI